MEAFASSNPRSLIHGSEEVLGTILRADLLFFDDMFESLEHQGAQSGPALGGEKFCFPCELIRQFNRCFHAP